MKKHVFIVIVLSGLLSSAFSQIPNPGFESWSAGEPDGWVTSNAPPAGLVNVIQTDDRHSGNFALRGDVISFFGTPMGCVIQSGPGGTGFPISEAYQAVDLYYKFNSVDGDKFSVNIAFENDGNVIAQGAVAIPTTLSGYTFLSVPMNYAFAEVPDLAIIQISITGPVTGNDVHVGSYMIIDDLTFSSSTGIDNLTPLVQEVQCFPNPAGEIVNLKIAGKLSGKAHVEIYDCLGSLIKILPGFSTGENDQLISIPLEELSSGFYLFTIKNDDKFVTGKFTVSH